MWRTDIIDTVLHLTESLRKLDSALLALLKRCVILGMFLCLSGSAQTGPAKTSPKDRLQIADQYYVEGRFPLAEQELRSVLLQSPQNYAANEMLALVLSAEGRDAEATAFFEKAVKADPGSQKARENLAANYAKCGKNALAEVEFKRLVKLDPGNFDLNHNFGEFYVKLGKISDAIKLLIAAQHIKPADYTNGYDLALGLLMLGRLAEAQEQLESMLTIKETAELHSMLAEVYEKRSMFLPAAEQFQRAAQMDPTEDTLVAWGAELLRHSNLKEAEQVFNSGVKLYPQSWPMNTGLGITEHMLGEDGDATKTLIHAADLNSADPRSYSFLEVIDRVPPGLMPEVTSRFQQYAQQYPKRAQAQFLYAANLWRADEMLNQTENAARIESLLKTAIALDPKLAEAHTQLGILYARRGEYDAAAAEFEQTIKLDPDQPTAHYHLGQALIHLGQKERGDEQLKIFRKLHSEQKDDTVIAFLMTRQDQAK
jgi:Tfp pilus assembly protein PilF